MNDFEFTGYPKPKRPTRLQWLKEYLFGRCAEGFEGELLVRVKIHRGSIAHIKIQEVKECAIQIP